MSLSRLILADREIARSQPDQAGISEVLIIFSAVSVDESVARSVARPAPATGTRGAAGPRLEGTVEPGRIIESERGTDRPHRQVSLDQ
jgi:hypothetical protein